MWPLVEVTLGPASATDSIALRQALVRLTAEDDAMSFDVDVAMDRVALRGASVAALNSHIDALRAIGAFCVVGPARICYHETIIRAVKTHYTYAKPINVVPRYASVTIIFAPLDRYAGTTFRSEMSKEALPASFLAAIERGIRAAARCGVLAGFPTVDFQSTLIDARYHDVDSTEDAFETAARACFRELGKTDAVRLLEPIMKVDVVCAPRDAAAIRRDFLRRNGRILELALDTRDARVTALAPLAQLLEWAETLEKLAHGEARFTLVLHGHEYASLPTPPDDRFRPAVAMRS